MDILEKKYQMAGGQKLLGRPLGEKRIHPDGEGQSREYEHGTIVWHPMLATSDDPSDGAAVIMKRAIWERWNELGAEDGSLGYPLGDAETTADRRGIRQWFQHGVVYFLPESGVHEVQGPILEKWIDLGMERGVLGYPLSGETRQESRNRRYNRFENGWVYWTREAGAFVEVRSLQFHTPNPAFTGTQRRRAR